jgi:hypothetical protein
LKREGCGVDEQGQGKKPEQAGRDESGEQSVSASASAKGQAGR